LNVRTFWLARTEQELSTVSLTAGWLTDAERSRAGQLRYAKRRIDFLLGRWTLKLAVARVLGWPDDPAGLARIEGRTAVDGAPELHVDGQRAARGISLSDRAGCAVCLIAGEPADVGCDIEIVEPRSAAFVRDYLTEPEALFVEAAGEARDLAANLFWSAKESALKVLRTGLRRDTRSVEVTVADLRPPECTWSRLAVRTVEGPVFPGWWRRSGPFLFTVCARSEGPAPAALEAASPLDEALPSHQWMDHPRA
jgi:4'-phosphopantetheinyl transferase